METSPNKTKHRDGFLALYIGMRLSLHSKECVRFGLMNGCECILEKIIFNDEEPLPDDLVAGEPWTLTYMPVSLLLRALDVPWALTSTSLPSLPPEMSRQGLFQLRPSSVNLRVKLEKDLCLDILRTQFAVHPADTKIVYGAQGETYDSVIVDMERPPRDTSERFWLACYVMLSRARSLEGLLVLRAARKEDLDRKPPKYLLDEIDRLLALEKQSTQDLSKYLHNLKGKVPGAILALFSSDAEEKECLQVQAASKHNIFLTIF